MILKICSSYGKIRLYARPKITNHRDSRGGWFNRELKLLLVFFGLISFYNLVFSDNTFALYTPTLSASVDKSDITVSGNDVLRFDKTSFNLLTLIVKTNNRTGYTASISSETNDTSLKNLESTSGAKIESIAEDLPLGDFTANTWGYKMWSENTFKPIPPVSSPVNIIKTTESVGYNASELRTINFAMKLGDTLESGSYTNKMIISVVANPYERRAVMTTGKDFNDKMQAFDPQRSGESSNGFRIKHFKRSTVAPVASDNAIGIESADLSDYEIKLWFNLAEETMYYYSPTETTFLNPDSAAMFAWFIKLQDIDLSHFDTSEVKNMMQMFIGLYSCTVLDLSKFDTRNVINMYQMFAHDRSLVNLNLANFDTSHVTNMAGMFDDLSNVVSLDLSNFNTYNVTNMNHMFHLDSKLTNLNVSGPRFNTSNVTNMEAMFSGLQELTSLNVTRFNTSKVTNMASMFYNTAKLTNLDVRNFNTENVTNMRYMFSFMAELTALDLSSFNTGNVISMESMFNSTKSLLNLDLSRFNTKNVTNMAQMFGMMEAIEHLNVSSFDTSKVTTMNGMFSSMPSLKVLDISSFNTNKVEDMGYIFAIDNGDRDNLTTIYASDSFVTDNVINSQGIFNYRKKLRGGNGSYLVNPNMADKTWLRVDRPGAQGYFTRKA